MSKSIIIPAYNSKTGAGTLSGISAEYGVSVKDILAANPSIKNPDLIQAGASLNIPNASPLATTSSVRSDINVASSKLDGALNRTSAQANNELPQYDSAGGFTSGGKYYGPDSPEAKNSKAYPNGKPTSTAVLYNANGEQTDENGQIIKGGKTNFGKAKTPEEQAIENATNNASSQLKQAETLYQNLRGSINASTDSLISSIRSSYQARITAMEDSNKRYRAFKETVGYRSGRAQYGAKVQQGILTDEEQAGQMRISQLSADMNTAIAKAETARTAQDYKALKELMDRSDKIQSDLSKEIQEQFNRTKEQERLDMQKTKDEADQAYREEEQGMKKAKASAPALVAALAGKTPQQQADFLAAYAQQTGIDVGVLMGEVETASKADKKADLDIANINNQIYNRNRTTQLAIDKDDRANGGITDDSGNIDQDTMQTETKNILSGATKFIDVDSKNLEKVKNDLVELGFYSDDVPAWYVLMEESKRGQSLMPEQVAQAWEMYRQSIIGSK